MRNIFKVIKNPSIWFRDYNTDHTWDNTLNGILNQNLEIKLLDEDKDFKSLPLQIVRLNGVAVRVDGKYLNVIGDDIHNSSNNYERLSSYFTNQSLYTLPKRVAVMRLIDYVKLNIPKLLSKNGSLKIIYFHGKSYY